MRRTARFGGAILAIVAAVGLASACREALDRGAMIEETLATKKDITILVTDSGLGGLSVAADVAARLPASGVVEKARIVFYNALFHSSGYNNLKTEAEKARIFNAVLKAMERRYHPDLLLIACNTLSVVYDKTPFAKRAPFPAVGIVETGVDLIARELERQPQASVIVFGTLTTVESNAHKNLLVERGFAADRIIGQACHRLAGAIERGTDSEETVGYIRRFVGEALAKLKDPATPVFGSFNCTHFGYTRRQFADAFAAAGRPGIVLLDPNPLMADFMFQPPYLGRYPRTEVSVEVISKLEITKQERASIGPLLRAVSPQTADAFENYTWDPGLFKVKFTPPPEKKTN